MCRRFWAFFGKLYVLRAAYEGGLAWLAVAGVVASVIGAFYYLRIVFYMYFGEEGEGLETGRSPVQWAFLMASAAVMLLGIINMFGVETWHRRRRRRLSTEPALHLTTPVTRLGRVALFMMVPDERGAAHE